MLLMSVNEILATLEDDRPGDQGASALYAHRMQRQVFHRLDGWPHSISPRYSQVHPSLYKSLESQEVLSYSVKGTETSVET